MPRKASAPAARPRVRRTQEERSAATRAKVVEAATECVAELGYRGATMSAMAQRAGVSWGAMQHQFGEKDAIFDAVIEQVMARLQENFRGLREEHPELPDRVHAFVQRNRELAGGPIYRAFVEIDAYDIIWASGAFHCIVMQVPRRIEPDPAAALTSPGGGELIVPGSLHEITWGGENESGNLVNAGPYIVRFEVTDTTTGGKQTEHHALILTKGGAGQ